MTNGFRRATRLTPTRTYICKCGKHWAMCDFDVPPNNKTRPVFWKGEKFFRKGYECDCGRVKE